VSKKIEPKFELKALNLIKEHKISQTKFAEYTGYTLPGLHRSIKLERRQKIWYAAALVMVLEKKGIDLEAMLTTPEPEPTVRVKWTKRINKLMSTLFNL